MPDIFDKIKPDVFDKLAPDSVATQARSRLFQQGLTPEIVKQDAWNNVTGRGVTRPESITFAPRKEVNGGFLGGLLSNPLHALDSALDSAQQFTVMGTREPTPGDALNVAGIPNYKQIADESYRRGEANESTADMYGNATQAAALFAATKGAPAAFRAVEPVARDMAAETAIKGYNKMIGATPKDAASGGMPGRGVASIGPESWRGAGRLGEIDSALNTATKAKDNFMATDINAKYRVFDPEPLIREAIEAKRSLATSSGPFRENLSEFAGRMRKAVSDITKGEQRALSAAEMDRLRDSIDANWQAANKKFQVVAETDARMNDAAVDMDRAIRQALEGEKSPVARQYKEFNQRIQDLAQAKKIQARTNTQEMFPEPQPSAERSLYGEGRRLAGKALGAAVPPPAKNWFLDMLADYGGLKKPLPAAQGAQPPIPGLSEPSYGGLSSEVPLPRRGADMAAPASGPAIDPRTSPLVDRASNLQTFAKDALRIPDESAAMVPGQRPVLLGYEQPRGFPYTIPENVLEHIGKLQEMGMQKEAAALQAEYLRRVMSGVQ